MPTSSEARLDSDGLNSKFMLFCDALNWYSVITVYFYLSRYLSSFLYILTPEGDIGRVPVNQVLGVSLIFFFFLCAMLVVLVVSERSQCLPYSAERQAT